MSDVTTVESVIEKLGGGSAVSAILGVTPQAVGNMKARGTIPPRHWSKLVEAATAQDKPEITFEALAAIETTRAA